MELSQSNNGTHCSVGLTLCIKSAGKEVSVVLVLELKSRPWLKSVGCLSAIQWVYDWFQWFTTFDLRIHNCCVNIDNLQSRSLFCFFHSSVVNSTYLGRFSKTVIDSWLPLSRFIHYISVSFAWYICPSGCPCCSNVHSGSEFVFGVVVVSSWILICWQWKY